MKVSYFNHRPMGKFLRNLGGSMILALLISLFTYNSSAKSLEALFITYAWAFAICYTQWVGHSFIFTLLDRTYSWQNHPWKRAISGSLAIIIYAVLAYAIVSLLMARIVYGNWPENPLLWGVKTSYVAIIVSFAVSIVFLSIGFFQSWKNSLLEAENYKAEMLRYKYESLQNQINPHFLFNSFNVLSDLVYEDQKKAVNFISQMSQLFRYVLDSRDKELVPIAEELDFISSFAYLLQTRFEDKLSIQIDVESTGDELIVPMTLQLLIENCVKHNEISASKPLHIHIFRDDTTIQVANKLQPKLVGDRSRGTGLNNLVQQYSFFTKRQIIVNETHQDFVVKVPLIKTSDR